MATVGQQLSNAADDDDSLAREIVRMGLYKGNPVFQSYTEELELTMKLPAPTTPSPPLRSLSPIQVSQGAAAAAAAGHLGARFPGRVLLGTLFGTVPTLTTVSGVIAALLRDEQGDEAGILLQNHAISTITQEQVVQMFPLGMKIAIKEPVFRKMLHVRSIHIVVGSPANIQPISFLSARRLAIFRPMNSEALREEGNKLFRSGLLDSAAEVYEMSATRAREEDDSGSTKRIVLARSNRALCLLNTGRPELAVEEAEIVLKLDPGHLKTLLRKAMALQKLQLHVWAAKVLRSALELHPEESELIGPKLVAAEKLAMQSTLGSFSLTGDCFEEEFAEYASGVEIRICEEPGRDRGLFATRDFKPRDVVLTSRALAFSNDPDTGSKDLEISLVHKAMRSTRARKQIAHLQTRGPLSEQLEAPEMKIYRPNWTTPEEFEAAGGRLMSDDPEEERDDRGVDLELINEIVDELSFYPRSALCVVWPLPSFINHSCSSNISWFCFGSTFVCRALGEIKAGDEITHSYNHPGYPLRVSSRRKLCSCPRCELEAGVEEELKPVSRWYLNPEESGGGYGLKPGVNFVRAVQQLEQILHQRVEVEGERQWLRCGYWELYRGYYRRCLQQRGGVTTGKVCGVAWIPPADVIMEAMFEQGRGYSLMASYMESLVEFAIDRKRAEEMVELAREAESG